MFLTGQYYRPASLLDTEVKSSPTDMSYPASVDSKIAFDRKELKYLVVSLEKFGLWVFFSPPQLYDRRWVWPEVSLYADNFLVSAKSLSNHKPSAEFAMLLLGNKYSLDAFWSWTLFSSLGNNGSMYLFCQWLIHCWFGTDGGWQALMTFFFFVF